MEVIKIWKLPAMAKAKAQKCGLQGYHLGLYTLQVRSYPSKIDLVSIWFKMILT